MNSAAGEGDTGLLQAAEPLPLRPEAGTGALPLRSSGVGRLARVVNATISGLGIDLLDPSFDAIVASAERRVRRSDWGSDGFLRRLRTAVDLAEADSRLTPLGRLACHVIYNWHATNRLRIVDYAKCHPEVADVEIEKPIFITGLYRTATTNLHNLLSLDANHRVPWCWELCHPLALYANPERDRRARIRRTARRWWLGDMIAPNQKYAHELRADGPEECFFLLANSGFFVQQIIGWCGYTYARTLEETDLSDAYQELRLQYQVLAAQRPGLQWIMKCPQHLWFLDELVKAFPDARIIHTHRAVAEAIPSLCSLSAIMAEPMAADFDPVRHGQFFHEYCRSGLQRAMRSRKRIPADRLLDIRMTDLTRDPAGTVRKVYDHFGLTWDDAMPAKITAHLEHESARRGTRSRKHSYTADRFGLDAKALSLEFADYEREFLDD